MLRSALILVLLAGCNSAPVTDVTRAAAKQVVNTELRRDLPDNVNAEPITDCVIDNATTGEILTLASAAATGPTRRTTETLGRMLRRQSTLQCIGAEALPTLLTSL